MQHKGTRGALAGMLAGHLSGISAIHVVWVPKLDDRAVWAFFRGLAALILNWQIS